MNELKDLTSNRAFAVKTFCGLLLAVGGALTIEAWIEYTAMKAAGQSAVGLMPLALGLLWTATALGKLLEEVWKRQGDSRESEGINYWAFVAIFIFLLVYAFAFERVGFVVSSSVCGFVAMKWLGVKRISMAAGTSIGIALLLYFILVDAFSLVLPTLGIFGI